MDPQAVIEDTSRWIAEVVIGLNLCPFAKRVFDGGKIRYVVSATTDENILFQELAKEVDALATASMEDIETTLLIHPHVLADFLDYNDFLAAAESVIEEFGFEGVVQIAGFHPDYQFADTAAEDVENYSNRSPYPMLHLLREDSISAVAENPEELLDIPRRNVETLRDLGREKILEMLQALHRPRQSE